MFRSDSVCGAKAYCQYLDLRSLQPFLMKNYKNIPLKSNLYKYYMDSKNSRKAFEFYQIKPLDLLETQIPNMSIDQLNIFFKKDSKVMDEMGEKDFLIIANNYLSYKEKLIFISPSIMYRHTGDFRYLIKLKALIKKSNNNITSIVDIQDISMNGLKINLNHSWYKKYRRHLN